MNKISIMSTKYPQLRNVKGILDKIESLQIKRQTAIDGININSEFLNTLNKYNIKEVDFRKWLSKSIFDITTITKEHLETTLKKIESIINSIEPMRTNINNQDKKNIAGKCLLMSECYKGISDSKTFKNEQAIIEEAIKLLDEVSSESTA